MRIDRKTKLFFGLKIDSKLREALAKATPGDRHYFDDPSNEFLRILANGEEEWIGKIVEPSIAPTQVEDIQRNVISILNRIAPGGRHSAANMRIFCVDETAEPAPAPEPTATDTTGGYGGMGGGGFAGGGAGGFL